MSHPTRNRLLFVLFSALLVVPLLTGAFVGARPADDEDDPYKFLSVFTEVLRLVRTVYVEEPKLEALMAGAMDGTSDALDPFSFYVPAERAKSFGSAQEEGRRASGLVILRERGVAFVLAVDSGGAADTSGIERGDILSKIGERSTRDMPMWEVHETLAGRRGSQIEVEVVRQGSPIDVEIDLGSSGIAPPTMVEIDGYSVVKLAQFQSDTRDLLAELLGESGERPVLIDLRGAAGGDIAAAYNVAGLFASGTLGELRKREEKLEGFENDDSPVFGSAPSLLVDRGSQGAAEVFASVLIQSAGALLLGEPTFGHAGRSERVVLSSGAFLNLTSAFYTGPDLEPLDESLRPEIFVRRRRFGAEETDDDVLKKAIEALREHSEKQTGEQRRAA